MTLDLLASGALRALLLLAVALAVTASRARTSAALRRVVLASALTGALALPLLVALVPGVPLETRAAATFVRGKAVAEPEVLAPAPELAAVAPRRAFAAARAPERTLDWRAALVLVWVLGALALAARAVVGLVRAGALVRRARPPEGLEWAHAIARAARQTGIVARVRVTHELDAPAVSGLSSPTVLVPSSSGG